MKAIFISIGITLAVFLSCLLISNYVVATCNELNATKDSALQAVLSDDFEGAQYHLETLQARWQSLEGHWEMLCNHDDLTLVSTAVERALILCNQRDAEKLELECAQIEFALLNISHKERVSIENII